MTHRGIELRISIPGPPTGNPFEANPEVIVLADSDVLHLQAKLRQDAPSGWSELLRTVEGMLIETRAVDLPDDYPDPENDESGVPYCEQHGVWHLSSCRDWQAGLDQGAAGDSGIQEFSLRSEIPARSAWARCCRARRRRRRGLSESLAVARRPPR